ncbi:MAG: integrase arm-type DNA-binding domain-containing protein [Methylibium sp.]|uniref:tyrosine-type recombinase/integrase n=1 Tax=Methylibium sp. TaxID=2067992 RepID=UPI00183C2C42|nr:integrase arm-type DNA-binding domain-containing protein [Methylibium sp.]MBA3597949.1 integrase arm-type DNA-binding domain-containing protein [Methylibium sp.]
MLTDKDCRNATCPPELKRRRLTDGAGLYLEVAPGGSRRWFWKFYPDGKESRLALGSYPNVSLKSARSARDEARRSRAAGGDPVKLRKAERIAKVTSRETTFEAVAREFHASKLASWSENHAAQWLRCTEKDLFPWLGALPLAEITAPVLLGALRRVQRRGAIRTGHDLREFAGQVFRYGIATGRCDRNVAADLRGALEAFVEKHAAAVLEPAEAGELMRNILAYNGQPTTRAALVLSALTFQRPGNIRTMEWNEINLDAALWTIPAEKMKRSVHGKMNGRPHLVPLAQQAVEILRELQPLTGRGALVFPGLHSRERPMSENTVNLALRRMGYTDQEMCAHGFRAMARTILVERTNVPPDAIEAQLAHGKSGPLGTAYDRAEFMEQRRSMMQTWADYLDQLRRQADGMDRAAA